MFVNDLYLSCALYSCFDGDGAGDAGGAGAGAGSGEGGAGDAGAGAVAGAGAGDANKTFTQEQLNKILADDRRKHQQQLAKVESSYKDLLANSTNLSDKERHALEENLATVQGQLRTKEQQLAIEKKELETAYTGKLTAAEQKATQWESRYRDETIARSLHDAASVNDAFRPEQIVMVLKAKTKLVEEVDQKTNKPTGLFRPMVDFDDVDANTGEPITTTRTPQEAVKRMKELPEIYGNLFKSNVVSGIGSNSSTGGVIPGAKGKIDVSKLTPQQYREIREKTPELLGLVRSRRR